MSVSSEVSSKVKSRSLRLIAEQEDPRAAITQFAQAHPAFEHPLFERLRQGAFSCEKLGKLLKNYDAHASQLRRLLLKVATIMPEQAVGLILENVRNEYGNGCEADRHQLQLQSLAWALDISVEQYKQFAVEAEVRKFIKDVTPLYFPLAANYCSEIISSKSLPKTILRKAAIAAGAVTATELMAVEEFKALQITFGHYGLQEHIWFDHVQVECEHSDESVALAIYFIEKYDDFEAVQFGLQGVLDANLHLYNGLLATLS